MPPTESDSTATPAYRPDTWPRPSVTVDLVMFTVRDTDLKVLLIERGQHPAAGSLALPGGFVRVGDGPTDQGESLEAAARRELQEETSLPAHQVYLEQLYTFGQPGRDPRTRVITVAYYALVRSDLAPRIQAGTDAADVRWYSVEHEIPHVQLAFDHTDILSTAIRRIRGKIDYSPIAFELVPEAFTIAELRSIHEAIQGRSYDPGNFRRRFKRMQTDGLIDRAVGHRNTATKPAAVFRFLRGRASP